MDVTLARSILNEAQNGGWREGDYPEDEAEIVSEASYWVVEARKAHATGMKDPEIVAIVNMGESLDVAHHDAGPPEAPDSKPPRPRRSSGGYSESDEREGASAPAPGHPLEAFIGQENLPIPAEIEGDPNPMPRDLTSLSDQKVRQLHGEYGAYLSRSKWLLAVASSDVAHATHLRDDAYRVALQAVERVDDETKSKKLSSVIEAEAKEDKKYADLDGQLRGHTSRQTAFKALVDIYSGNVERLSREWTMRQDEYGKTR